MKYNYDEDGVAFYYFLLTSLLIAGVVISYLWYQDIKRRRSLRASAALAVPCDCPGCQEKKKNKTSSSSYWKPAAVFFILLSSALITSRVWDAKLSYTPYNPFEILGLSESASDKQIKKAFKMLSIRWHPDKNPDDLQAASAKFMEIQKAYKALTDETNRKNWEEYGNPDGPRGFSLGIALPAWLIQSAASRTLVLLLYALLFGLLLPWIVYRGWNYSRRYTRDSISHASMTLFFKELRETMTGRRILEIISMSPDFSDLSSNDPVLTEGVPSCLKTDLSRRVYGLLWCHLNRIPLENEKDKAEQRIVILKTMQLLLGMLHVANTRDWFQCARALMTACLCLVQAVWSDPQPLLQLPWVTSEMLRGKKLPRNIPAFLELPEKERRSLLAALDDAQYDNLLAVARGTPQLVIQGVHFKVLGQDSIHPGNIVTCLIRLKLRKGTSGEAKEEANLIEETLEQFEWDEDGQMVEKKAASSPDDLLTNPNPPVHAPYFPVDKRPSWWVCLCSVSGRDAICPPKRIHDLTDTKTVTLQFPAPRDTGLMQLAVLVKSDSILGADLDMRCNFRVTDAPRNQEPEERWVLTDESDSGKANPFMQDDEDE